MGTAVINKFPLIASIDADAHAHRNIPGVRSTVKNRLLTEKEDG
jgi:hypothetical protein